MVVVVDRFSRLSCLCTLALFAGCSDAPQSVVPEAETSTLIAAKDTSQQASSEQSRAARNAYFGELHVHTQYSFDAFIFVAFCYMALTFTMVFAFRKLENHLLRQIFQ